MNQTQLRVPALHHFEFTPDTKRSSVLRTRDEPELGFCNFHFLIQNSLLSLTHRRIKENVRVHFLRPLCTVVRFLDTEYRLVGTACVMRGTRDMQIHLKVGLAKSDWTRLFAPCGLSTYPQRNGTVYAACVPLKRTLTAISTVRDGWDVMSPENRRQSPSARSCWADMVREWMFGVKAAGKQSAFAEADEIVEYIHRYFVATTIILDWGFRGPG